MLNHGTITLPNGQTIGAGQGGSYSVGSDRHPITIIGWTKSGKTIYYRAANAKRTDSNGLSECQSYEFTPNPNGRVSVATWRRRAKRFKPKGHSFANIWTNGYDKYSDPSF